MADIIILADDLTGAADSAAACMWHGLSASVVLHSSRRSETTWPLSDLVSIDANTRCLSASDAAATTSHIVRIWHENGALPPGCLLFKKLDSTMRGHFAAELAAILRQLRAMAPDQEKPCIVMAPALPSQGRTTIGAIQMLHGRPIHEAGIPALLAQEGLSCRTIDIATVRAVSPALQHSMLRFSRVADVLVCDAESDEDLHRIAEASMILHDRAVWAGSAGMVAQLPQAAGLAINTRTAQPIAFEPGPTLFVVGSFASVSREQANFLSAVSKVATLHFQMTSHLSSFDPLLDALLSKRDALLVLDQYERCSERDADSFARTIAQFVTSIAPLLGGVVATGGETARTLLDALGIRGLRLVCEVEPGIPFSIAENWIHPLPIITKAGGFGSRESLLRCREFLQVLQRSSAFPHASTPPVS